MDDGYDWPAVLKDSIALGWQDNEIPVVSFSFEIAEILAADLHCKLEVTKESYVFHASPERLQSAT